MPRFIHRNGEQYRLWSTITDTYLTAPMPRPEMFGWLLDGGDGCTTETEVARRLARADAQGTSQAGDSRSADEWESERCNGCAGFHHEYSARPDGACGACGEAADDVQHQPPCGAMEGP